MKRSIPWVLMALLIVLCFCLVCVLAAVALFRPDWLPIDLSGLSRDRIVLRVPDRGQEADYYLLRPGQDIDNGRLLADDAIQASTTWWGQQTGEGFAWHPLAFGAFIPESGALLYSVQTPDETSLLYLGRRRSDPVQVLETDARITTLLTLEDGETVFVVEGLEAGRVRCFLSHNGEEAQRVARGDSCEVSSNGSTLLVSDSTTDALTLTALNLDGTGEVALLDGAEDTDLTFRLSGDGTQVAYVRSEAELPHVVILSREDGSVVLEGDDLYSLLSYEFSPVGPALFVIGETEEGDLALSLLEEQSSIVATGQALEAAFSSDGQYLIYLVAEEAGDEALFIHPMAGGDDLALLEGGDLSFAIVQSTGELLLLQTLEGETILYRAEPSGDSFEELLSLDQPSVVEVFDLPGSPRFFARTTDADGRQTLFVGPSQDEPGLELLEDWFGVAPLDLSPDGRTLAFLGQEEARDDPVLFAIDLVEDASPLELDDDHVGVLSALFTDDGRELFYTAQTGPDPEEVEVRRILSRGTRPYEVLYPEAALEAASWGTPDPFASSTLSFLSGIATPSLCPEALAITPGQEVEGDLESGGRDCYRFRTGEALEYAVGVLADEQLDSRLEVYDRQGNLIASDDDSGPALSPRLHLTLEQSGLYYIYVFGFGDDDAGPYTLTLTEGLPQTLQEGAVLLPLDETVRGAITAESEVMVEEFETSFFGAVYYFNAQPEDWMIADLSARSIGSSLDPMLYLLDPNLEAVAFADPDPDGDLHLETAIPASGRYYLLVINTDEGFGTSDDYFFDLTLTRGIPPEPGGGPISIGESVDGDLQVGIHDEWTFTAAAGDYVTISMVSDDFDTYLELYGPSGAILTQDDDSGGDLDSLIRNVQLPSAGEYAIHARSYSSREAGQYTLSLSRGAPDISTGGAIEMGETVEGDLGPGARDQWTFTGAAGQVITIHMTSESVDPYLELLDPDGLQLIVNDDGAGYPNALIEEFELPVSGIYTIIARSFGDSRSGPYVLLLEEVLR